MLETSSDLKSTVVEIATERSIHVTLQLAEGLVTVTPVKCFNIQLINTSKETELPTKEKYMILSHAMSCTAHITTTKAALQKPDHVSIGTIYSTPPADGDPRIKCHRDAE